MTKPRATNLGAAAQANSFRPRYAMEVASPPDGRKPETGDEEMGKSSHRTSRGERGRAQGQINRGTWGDLYVHGKRYLNVEPSKKSLQRERDRINELTDRSQGCTPIPRLIERLNRHWKGWANYFSFDYPRKAFRTTDWHLGYRLANHLKHHRSQRPYQLPKGVTYYQHFQTLGLQFLKLQTCESR